jgi:Tol biopolymer transport system component
MPLVFKGGSSMLRSAVGDLSVLLVALCAVSTWVLADPGDTICASVSSSGEYGNDESAHCSISADGRYVAFDSWASNLVDGDTNGVRDVFVHDCLTGETTRVSVSSEGAQGNEGSVEPSTSADGRYVAFASQASNLVPDDTNDTQDIFVHDRLTGETTCVSRSSCGELAAGSSSSPAISGDGRFVAFTSGAANLVDGDTNGHQDVFVHDCTTGQTTRVSVSSAGDQADGTSHDPAVSADGTCAAFHSEATNLVADDTNGCPDVFLHDRLTGVTQRVSVSTAGEQGDGRSERPAIAGEGVQIAFQSKATNLVPDDMNNAGDVFVRDLQTGITSRVSVRSDGSEGNDVSDEPAITAGGTLVAFTSYVGTMVPGDTNGELDVFVHDRVTGETTRVSVNSLAEEGNGESWKPAISSDGRFVAFQSSATNLAPDDTNGCQDIFVHEREATYCDVSGTVTFQDLDAAATPPASVQVRVTWNGWLFGSYEAALAPDGSYSLSLPAGSLTLSIKHTHWLRQTVPADNSAGPISGIDFSLVNGDCYDDNSVDLLDLTQVLVHFGATDPMADVNESGLVDLGDLNVILINFAKFGDE